MKIVILLLLLSTWIWISLNFIHKEYKCVFESLTGGHYVNHTSLFLLTGNIQKESLNCTAPLVPFYDRIVEGLSTAKKCEAQKIPRVLHVTFISRCLPQDIETNLQRWAKALPNYSIYFHDDEAVKRLMNEEWPEFPTLHDAMRCIQYKGAMVTDLWRILVIYKYGGLYTDIDNTPTGIFTEELITNYHSGFFFTDSYWRPSQNIFAIEPKHPIAFMTMTKILKNLFEMENIANPKLIETTGPNALNDGFKQFIYEDPTTELLSKDRNWKGLNNKIVRRLNHKSSRITVSRKYGYEDIVQHPFNASMTISRSDRIDIESGSYHWQKAIRRERDNKFQGSCKDYLADKFVPSSFL